MQGSPAGDEVLGGPEVKDSASKDPFKPAEARPSCRRTLKGTLARTNLAGGRLKRRGRGSMPTPAGDEVHGGPEVKDSASKDPFKPVGAGSRQTDRLRLRLNLFSLISMRVPRRLPARHRDMQAHSTLPAYHINGSRFTSLI